MNIYEKILDIMQQVRYLSKDDKVEFGSTKYKALSEEKITSIMRKQLIDHKMVVYPVVMTSSRVGNISHVDVVYRMVNSENPEEYIDITSCGDGADTQDKGSGKAMTYAFKYMWLRTFAIPTGEDPDKISNEEIEAKAAESDADGDRSGAAHWIDPDPNAEKVLCKGCGKQFRDYWDGNAFFTAKQMAKRSEDMYGVPLCVKCARNADGKN